MIADEERPQDNISCGTEILNSKRQLERQKAASKTNIQNYSFALLEF
jgi:hypothetical protein